MKTTADFLDALRVKLALNSDGKLADYLGMHRQHVSRYRTLGGTFDDDMAMRVADILETDPAYVVACMHAQRAKSAEQKKLWERIASLAAGVAAVLVVSALPWDNSGALLLAGFTSGTPSLYIMSNYWPLLLTLALALLWAFPRYTSRPNN